MDAPIFDRLVAYFMFAQAHKFTKTNSDCNIYFGV